MELNKLGRYELKRVIGHGGMSTVYLANDPQVGREVGIKVLRPTLMHDPAFRARFEREVRTIATLEHSAIVPVYDYGQEEDYLYIVMRLMTGGSLDWLLKQGSVPRGRIVSILKRVGAALDTSHNRGIVHRDLKPANILFDKQGHAFLSDFGIVKLTDTVHHITGTKGLIGTPAYMSPEQIQGDTTLDGRSDIYAIGILLFQMLTGHIPFEGDTPVQIMYRHLNTPVSEIVMGEPLLPAGCEPIIIRALAKPRDERYATVGTLVEELEQALITTPISGRANTEQPPRSKPERPRPTPVMRNQRYIYIERQPDTILIPPRPDQSRPPATVTIPLPPKPLEPPAEPTGLQFPHQARAYRQRLAEFQNRQAQQVKIYQDQLTMTRQVMTGHAEVQRRTLGEQHPPIETLLNYFNIRSVWHRQPDDDDFLHLRVGVGSSPSHMNIQWTSDTTNPLNHFGQTLARDFEHVDELPLTVDLTETTPLYIAGQQAVALIHTLLAHTVVHHSPQDVHLYVLSHHPQAEQRWGWLKWLPHTQALPKPENHSMLALTPQTTPAMLARLTKQLAKRGREVYQLRRQAHLLIILDRMPDVDLSTLPTGAQRHASLLLLEGSRPQTSSHILHTTSNNTLQRYGNTGQWQQGQAELTQIAQIERLARLLAPIHITTQPQLIAAHNKQTPPPDSSWQLHRIEPEGQYTPL